MKTIRMIISLVLCILPLAARAIHPVTGCYWEWMNGNISKEGITKDLEYMKDAGIEEGTEKVITFQFSQSQG